MSLGHSIRTGYAVLLACLLPVYGFAESEWRLAKEEDGVTVHVRNVAKSKIHEFKGVTRVRASLDSVAAVLYDNAAYPDWHYHCESTERLETLGFGAYYIYQVYGISFPISNRDVIFRTEFQQDPKTRIITIRVTGDPDYCERNQSEICQKTVVPRWVRISKSSGFYRLRPLSAQETEVTWQMHIEPGGWISSKLVNSIVPDIPKNTLEDLAQMVTREKYRNAKLEYGPDGVAVRFARGETLSRSTPAP